MKWWLISDETLNKVIRALKIGHAIAGGIITASTFADAQQCLEAEMHQTDAVPGDWGKPEGDAR